MMKAVTGISCFIAVLVLYNYPVFDNKGISCLILFLCLAAVSFAGAKIYSPDDHDEYETVEKEMDELLNFDGIFEYKKDGFYITQNKITDFVKWSDIIEVNSFNIPLPYRIKQAGLEIITDHKNYEFGSGNTPGIEKLEDQLFRNLSDWKLDSPLIKVNNNGLEKANLYTRKSIK